MTLLYHYSGIKILDPFSKWAKMNSVHNTYQVVGPYCCSHKLRRLSKMNSLESGYQGSCYTSTTYYQYDTGKISWPLMLYLYNGMIKYPYYLWVVRRIKWINTYEILRSFWCMPGAQWIVAILRLEQCFPKDGTWDVI